MASRDVLIHAVAESPRWGVPAGAPSAPLNVTSITRDGSADVSWFAPTSQGDSAITHYLITPYDGATPLSTTTVAVGSTTAVSTSAGTTARRYNVSGLTNNTAYTFKVAARNTQGDGPQSTASASNTPRAGQVFGDEFNGPADGPIDPEWWIYNRCAYLAQDEVAWYLPSQVRLDGNGRLELIAEHTSYTGTTYPSDGSRNNVTQPWRSGSVQGNTRTFYPSSGNTLVVDIGWQCNTHAADGYWPAPWLEGQSALNAWKTDPEQGGWNDTDRAEIDMAEWVPGQVSGPQQYLVNTWNSSSPDSGRVDGSGLNTSIHKYTVKWKPGVSSVFFQDDTQTHASAQSHVPASGAQFVLLLYFQMKDSSLTATESNYIDYVRVFDLNLG